MPVQLDLLYQSIVDKENRLIAYISDKSLLPALSDRNDRRLVSLVIKDKSGKQKFKLKNRLSTEDLWGAQLTFEVNAQKNQRFIKGIESIQLTIESPRGHQDKREEQTSEYFTFIEGKLDY